MRNRPARPPYVSDRRKPRLEDIAILAGGEVITEEMSRKLENESARGTQP